jgi:two-component system phosphate regulon sensor histidine kinase PhoR
VFKNQTPQQLSVLIALVTAVTVLVFYLILLALGQAEMETWAAVALLCAVFVATYYTNFRFIRYFLFRRIKLIYKLIHSSKLPSSFNDKAMDMSKDVIEEVEKEVNEWMIQQTMEQEAVKQESQFRREFIGNVSHELKTPIFNIQGFVHTLLDGGLYDNDINLLYLRRAAKNIERLQHIVDDLETINKLEAGQMVLDLVEFNVRELCDEVFADMEMRARERSIRLIYKDGAAQSFMVRADKENIRQVLTNLIHNSIKYGKEGGVTKASFYDMESYILIEISDNGIGISPEHLKHVFERFYRIDKSRSRDAGGTGLGLSIVKHILEAHKQKVTVRSNKGAGTTFGFTLEKV